MKIYDVSTGALHNPPRGVNDRLWQWHPIMQRPAPGASWIAYGEVDFRTPTSPARIVLFNSITGRKRILDQTTARCNCVLMGEFTYPWVTWSRGRIGNVYRYNVQTKITRRIRLPSDRDEYGAAVTPDGTVYVAQAGRACGTGARIWRVRPDGGTTLVHRFARGTEPYQINTFDTGSGIDLYFDLWTCSDGNYDIYKLVAVDTATARRSVAVRHVVASPAGEARPISQSLPPRLTPSGARRGGSPRTR